jgi:hypothetical protein
VQNSAGNTSLSVLDNQNVGVGATASSTLKLNVVGAAADGVIRVAGPYSEIQLRNKNSAYNVGDWKPEIYFLENGVFQSSISYAGGYFEFGAGISTASNIIGNILTLNSGALNLNGAAQTITFTDTAFGLIRGAISMPDVGTPSGYGMNITVNSGDMTFQTLNGTTRLTIKQAGNVGVGTTTPNASSIVDLTSTTQGFLPPRMTTAERIAITSPADGLIVFDTTVQNLCYRRDSTWVQVSFTAV